MNQGEFVGISRSHKIVPKNWGYEKWITNNEKYCGKILKIAKGKKTSWHYHNLKDEVMYVQSGSVSILFGLNKNIELAEATELVAGDSFHIPPGLIHRICAREDSDVFEFSTQHFDEDSIRIERGE